MQYRITQTDVLVSRQSHFCKKCYMELGFAIACILVLGIFTDTLEYLGVLAVPSLADI